MSKSEPQPQPPQPRLVDRFQEYLGEFVYGGIDGSVTTFAVVAGAVGAGLDSIIILILGFANLIADGFSMSVGAYLSAKAEHDNFKKHQAREYWEVKYTPHAEREEIREIYAAKGFSGELLEQVVEVICADRDRWVDIMMKEELGMLPAAKSPLTIGSVTFCAFVTVGLVPLLIYVWDWFSPFSGNRFLIAAILTGLAFVVIGWLKSYVTETSHWRSILETLALGVIAASLSYAVGDLLEALLR